MCCSRVYLCIFLWLKNPFHIFNHKSFLSVLQVAHWVSTKGRERPVCWQPNDWQWCVGVHDMGKKLQNGMWGTSVTRIECWSREPQLLSRDSKLAAGLMPRNLLILVGVRAAPEDQDGRVFTQRPWMLGAFPGNEVAWVWSGPCTCRY